jgi:hypothetical protein
VAGLVFGQASRDLLLTVNRLSSSSFVLSMVHTPAARLAADVDAASRRRAASSALLTHHTTPYPGCVLAGRSLRFFMRIRSNAIARKLQLKIASGSFTTTTRRPLAVGVHTNLTTPTQKWLEKVVVGEKLCPFARPFLKNPHLLRIVSSSATETNEAISDVCCEAKLLWEGDELHETTLIVFPNEEWIANFRDFVRLSWDLQTESLADFQPDLQIVLFHPQATHQTYRSEEESAGDYTIRSPFPTIHLLREGDVLKGAQAYPNLESLPARNRKHMIGLGLERCQRQLEDCCTTAPN